MLDKFGYILQKFLNDESIFFNFDNSSHQRCSLKKLFLKFSQIQWKAPVLESLFSKVVDLRPATLLKRDRNTGVFL